LPAEELFIIGIVEVLNNSIPPRFANRDKYRLDSIVKAKP
jgi:hypothetical protein